MIDLVIRELVRFIIHVGGGAAPRMEYGDITLMRAPKFIIVGAFHLH